MLTIPGYTLHQKLHEGATCIAFRATRQVDGRAVVLKVLNDDYLNAAGSSRYQHEFDILQRLQSDHITRSLSLEKCFNTMMIVFEDIGGESLSKLQKTYRFSVAEILRIAIDISDALAAIHAADITHRDINPANIVYNSDTQTVSLIDFGLSSVLKEEHVGVNHPRLIEGSLPYMSPEQTGRMNRAIDYRTDYYSLGATLYDLLTGRPPFAARDELELMHAHLAVYPVAPHEISPQIPHGVSQIVMKLLEKSAEQRYQSAWGIKADLQFALSTLETSGDVSAFHLARKDVPNRFHIPATVYGREQEVNALMACFGRTCAGRQELVLIAGYSGIGKTTLVREVYKPITHAHGFFASGKFDQFQRDIPFSAISVAFSKLVQHLLCEPNETLAEWKRRLLAALGDDAQRIIEIIPDLGLIIGAQTATTEFQIVDTQTRLLSALTRFVQVFCSADHPLVLFLDDLQWIDSASLTLLERLVDEHRIQYLMIIGAYRDNEVGTGHPFLHTLSEWKRSNAAVTMLSLQPLSHNHVTALIADATYSDATLVKSLTDLVYLKAQGNPFFTEELLKTLYQDGLLGFDQGETRWVWDIARIRTMAISDNVVDLMGEKIQRLGEAAQRILQLAACIGNTFDLETLAVISQSTISDSAKALRPAVTEGLIIPLGNSNQFMTESFAPDTTLSCMFAHDRIQQAAYLLVDDETRCALHLRIGRLLHRHAGDTPQQLFNIVNHLNLGQALIRDGDEQRLLVNLNVAAARKAREATAYAAATKYLELAQRKLAANAWEQDYSLAFSVHSLAMDVAFLARDFITMEHLGDTILANARTTLDKMCVYETRIGATASQGQFLRALELGFAALELLGVKYPSKITKVHILWGFLGTHMRIGRRGVDRLADLPVMTDPYRLAEMRLGPLMAMAAYSAMPSLLPLLLFRMIEISLRYGNGYCSAASYVGYGMLLCGLTKRISEADKLATLSLAIQKQFSDKGQASQVLILAYAVIRNWTMPLRQTLKPLLDGFRLATEGGDLHYIGISSFTYCHYSFHCGNELSSLVNDFQRFAETVQHAKQKLAHNIITQLWQATEILRGQSPYTTRLIGERYDERTMAAMHLHDNDYGSIALLNYLKLMLNYLFGDYAVAIQHGALARKYQENMLSSVPFGNYRFYDALACLAHYPSADVLSRWQIRLRVAQHRAKLKLWARHASENFQHKLDLVMAEQFRVQGRTNEAIKYYQKAIRGARASGIAQDEALANERAAMFHLDAGHEDIARMYMQAAAINYGRWGAAGKLKSLTARYPELLIGTTQERRSAASTTSLVGSDTASINSIDFKSLRKALKAIAEESVHSEMLKKIVSTAIEFAGAQRGILALRNHQGEFVVGAEGSVTGSSNMSSSSTIDDHSPIVQGIINFVVRTRESVVIHDAQAPQDRFFKLQHDQHVRTAGVRSVLCLPILVSTGDSVDHLGILYLENNLASYVFTEERIEVLEIIGVAAAGRLELSRKAITDGLTGLYNHEYFQSVLSQEFRHAQRKQRPLSVIMIDIDHFKRFNDDWGHQAGDAVLQTVARAIKNTCRGSDTVARYGGEEMAVVLPDTPSEDALALAEHIRQVIANAHVYIQGHPLHVTASLGVASVGHDITDKDALIHAADLSLYQSKVAGRNRVTRAA